MPSINFTSPGTGELAGRLSKARSCSRSAAVPAAPTRLDESRDAGEGGSFRLSSDLSIEALAKLEVRRRMEAKAGPPTVARSEAKSEGWSDPAFSRTMNFVPNRSSALPGNISLRHRLTRKIKIRATHEIMAARTTQLALFVDQLMPALRTISPVLAGNVFVGRRGTNPT
jgi:hypothetical protein